MSKDFAMLTAVQRLSQYFTREFARLDEGMEQAHESAALNERNIRIAEVNELSSTLNALFGTLSDQPDSDLFAIYVDQKTESKEPGTLESKNVSENETKTSNEIGSKGENVVSSTDYSSTLSPSQQRADAMLKEYRENTPRDISQHLPGNDKPIEVLGEGGTIILQAEGSTTAGQPAEDIRTEVTGIQGMDIDPARFLTRRSTTVVEG